MAARNISPVDIWGILKAAVINWACVPLPAPGAPNNNTFIFSLFGWGTKCLQTQRVHALNLLVYPRLLRESAW